MRHGPFLILLFAAFVGCSLLPNTAAEAAEAPVIYNDLSAVKTAITAGATHGFSNKSLVVAGVDHYLEFVPGGDLEVEPGSWTLAMTEPGNYHLLSSVFDRIAAGTIEPDGSLLVPGGTYMPSIDQHTSDDAYYSLTPVEDATLGFVALLR